MVQLMLRIFAFLFCLVFFSFSNAYCYARPKLSLMMKCCTGIFSFHLVFSFSYFVEVKNSDNNNNKTKQL